MRQGAHHFPRCIAWQLSVGVQRDDIFHLPQNSGLAHDSRKRLGQSVTQKGIQLAQLATLPLIPHPHAFGLIPATWPMKQKECIVICDTVFDVQRTNQLTRPLQQCVVIGQCRFGRITKVSQQGKVQIGVAIAEEANLQRFDQSLNAGYAGEHRGYHDQRTRLCRDALREIHARQALWCHQQRCQPVRQCDGQLARAEERQNGGQRHHPVRQSGDVERNDKAASERRSDNADRAQIEKHRYPSSEPRGNLADSNASLHRTFKP